ncbi:hypothetical protein [Chishuiella changwenlii]|uniref:hypothetical protein n=1 Tax=Chishuiella changwenlii TaxID=1434701 RepID=UPI002FD98859
MKAIKIILALLFILNSVHQLKAQHLDRDGTRKTLSTSIADFFPFPGVWTAESGNKIIKIDLKLDWILIDKDAIVSTNKSRPNYKMLLSYQVIDKKSEKVLANDKEGEKIYDKYSAWSTVNMNMNILADPIDYPLQLINKTNLKHSYSFQLMDYKNCFTYVAAKLTILPSKPNQLIWISEIMNEDNQDNDMEEYLNCKIINDNSKMTIPSILIFKRDNTSY